MRTLTAVGMLATTLASLSCYTMKQVTIDDLSAQRAPRVWVTRTDRSVVLVNDAQIFRGKLVGFVEGKYRELQPGDLHQMQVRKLAAGRTVSLVAAGIVGFAVAAVVVSGGEEHFDPCAGDEDCSDVP
jgi:hypothetical protein